jgi:hypothetical protein
MSSGVPRRVLVLILIGALLLSGCAAAHRQRDFRFMECLGIDSCSIPNKKAAPWSAKHETLYWEAVERLAKKEACAGDALTGKIAFQSELRQALRCGSSGLSLPWRASDEGIGKAFEMNAIEYLDIFKKMGAFTATPGIGVELTVSYYSRMRDGKPDLEGTDYYAVVEADGVVEIHWVLKMAI